MEPAVNLSTYAPEFIISTTIAGSTTSKALRSGATSPTAIALRSAATSIEISEGIGKIAAFSIILADQFDVSKQEFVWLDNPILSPERRIMLSLGYGSQFEELLDKEPMMVGEVKTISTSGFSGDIPKLTIQGYHQGHKFLTEESSGDKLIKLEKNDTFSTIAEKLANKIDLKKEYIGSSSSNIRIKTIDPTKLYTPIITKKTVVFNDFLRDAAKRVGYEFFVSRNTLFFMDPRIERGLGINLVVEWGKNLLQFSPTLNTSNLITNVEVRGHSNSKSFSWGKLARGKRLF